MTTLGSINSQNRVANYSANYRGSLSLPLPSRSSAPVIHRVHRLSSLSADYLSPRLIADKIRPSGFFSLPPLPLHMPGILSRAFDRIRYRWNAEFAKTSIENTSDRGAPCRCTRFRAACRNCLVRDAPPIHNRVRSGLENAWSASRGLTGSPVDSLAKWMGIRKAKVPLVHRLSSLRFSPSPSFLSLPFFSPFHFHFDRQGGQGGRGERHMPR